MAGFPRYEKAAALGLTAAFVLHRGAGFCQPHTSEPYTTATARHAASSSRHQPGESSQPDSLLEGEVIPINAADVDDLDRLPGIGPTKAQAIVDYRDRARPFQTRTSCWRCPGSAGATLEGLLDYITLD